MTSAKEQNKGLAEVERLALLSKKATVDPENYSLYLPMDDARFLRWLVDWFHANIAALRADREPATEAVLEDIPNEVCAAGMAAWDDTFGSPYTRYAAIYHAMHAALKGKGASQGVQLGELCVFKMCPKHKDFTGWWTVRSNPAYCAPLPIKEVCPVCAAAAPQKEAK